MFYSQLLLSKKGALGVIWMAAHCYKRLKKDQIQQTNIPSSVDKILDDEVPVVTHRILAFLLLGIVRIYSKKVEYLFHDCHETLNRLCGFKTAKSARAGVGVSRTHYHSITFPKTFELDVFDLDLLEDQDVVGGNVRSHKQVMRADGRRKDVSTSGLLHKENIPISEAYSNAHTPPRDVFGPHHMDQDLFGSSCSNINTCLDGIDVLRGTRFSLEDRLDPMLDEAEVQQMQNKQSDEDQRTNFPGLTNMESESVVNLSNTRSHLSPSLETLLGTRFALEDRLEPMILDEAEEERLYDRPSTNNESSNLSGRQHVEFETVAHQSPLGSDSIASPGILPESGFSLDDSPNFKLMEEAGKGQSQDKPSEKEHRVEEEHGENLRIRLNFQEVEHRDATASVDKAKSVEGMEIFTPGSGNHQRPEEINMAIVNPDSELRAVGVGNPKVANVQTPGRKERAKNSKKRKTLLDDTIVVPNKVFKSWLADPTDLKRARKTVPHTCLHAWAARQLGRVPQSFFEPLIPGISIDLGHLQCEKGRAPVIKSPDLSANQDGVESPVTHGDREQIPDVSSPVKEKSPVQTSIAPGTPITRSKSLRPHDAGAVAVLDILGHATSLESAEKWSSSSEPLELDVSFHEETNSYGGESLERGAYSARTRMTGSYLGRKFLDKKKRKEEEVLSLSRLLEGKTKKESARLFYEILVLKTRDCIDVQQEAAYRDILLRERPKLGQVSEN